MKILARLVTVVFLMIPSFAHAYFIASLNGNKAIDPAKPTHILISGRGQDLGRSPQNSALGVAAKMRETEPGTQVILISVWEDPTNRQSLESKGAVIAKVNDSVSFTTSTLMPELLRFSRISSLHFFGHNSPSLGTQTDGPGARFDFRENQVARLKGHFDKDAYMFIHGCNAAWLIAPLMSRELGIPVAGAFTGTHFERLNENQLFYVSSEKGAPNLNWAKANSKSYADERACANGGCLRMRPGNAPYDGHWGHLTNVSLGFYKFFCVRNSQTDCERAMARSLLHSVTTSHLTLQSTRADAIAAAKDFMCPPSKDRSLSDECSQAMEAALNGGSRTYSSLKSARALQCSFQSCEVKFKCTTTGGSAGIGECFAEPTMTGKATTQVEEFLAYVRGFEALTAH